MSSVDERRTEYRTELVLKVRMQKGAQPELVRTRDVSPRGAFLLTEQAVAPGTELTIEVSFPRALPHEHLDAVVRWSRPPGKGADFPAGIGVEWRTRPGPELLRALQADAEGAQNTQPPSPAPQRDQPLVRVLVADDNDHVRHIVKSGLLRSQQKIGDIRIEVVEADTGEAAWNRIEAGVDFVVLDIYMPIYDGAHVLERIRASDDHATLPVLAVSAGGPEAKQRALDNGADFFIAKPLRLADIVETLRSMMRLRGDT